MNIFFQLSIFILFSYTSSFDGLLGVTKFSNKRIGFQSSDESNEMENAARKKFIAQILRGKDITINILQKESNNVLDICTGDIETDICWDSIFTAEIECVISNLCIENELDDDFIIRLFVIIIELHDIVFRCYKFGCEDEFYSLEMVNNLHFLKEICPTYFPDFEGAMVEIIAQCLLVHSLKAAKVIGGTIKLIEELITRIKKNDKKLREAILPICSKLDILNNILAKTYLNLPQIHIDISNVSKYFNNKNILEYHEVIRKASENQTIERKLPKLFSLRLNDDRLNMVSIYINLKKLNRYWETGKYSDTECELIFHIHISALLWKYPRHITDSLSTLKYFRSLFTLETVEESKFAIFLRGLLPDGYSSILMNRYLLYNGRFEITVLRNLTKIVDYRTHLLKESSNIPLITFSDLGPKEKFNCMKTVIDYYMAYRKYTHNISENNGQRLTRRSIALYDICEILLDHLINLDLQIFSDNADNYVDLFVGLKELADKVIGCENAEDCVSFIDNPLFLDFYTKYHNTGLRIITIYNISYLLRRSTYDTGMRLYENHPCSKEVRQFYNAVDEFIADIENVSLRNFYDEVEVYNVLDHILRCIVEIKHRNYNFIKIDQLYKVNDSVSYSKIKKSDVQFRLNAIDKYWMDITLYTDVFTTSDVDFKSPLINLYNSKYISELDVSRLFYQFISLREDKEIWILQSGMKIRENKKKMDKLLCEIMFSTFKHIRSANERNKNVSEGLQSAQILYRNFKRRYAVAIDRKVVSEFDELKNNPARNGIRRLVEVLGIYVVFDEYRYHYLMITGSISSISNYISRGINFSSNMKIIYEALIRCCDFIDLNIQIGVTIPNSSVLYKINRQLSIIMEAIDEDNLAIVAEVLRLISYIRCIVGWYTIDDDIRLVLENFSELYANMLYSLDDTLIPEDKFAHHIIITNMLKSVSGKITKFPKNSLNEFIDEVCSFIAEIVGEETYGIFSELEFSRYKNLRDRFLILIDDLDWVVKKEDLCSIIGCRIYKASQYVTCDRFLKSFKKTPKGFNKNEIATLKFKSYCLLKNFLVEIDDGMEDYSEIDRKYLSLMSSIV